MSDLKTNIPTNLDLTKARSDWAAFKSSLEVPIKLNLEVDDKALKSLESATKALNQQPVSPELPNPTMDVGSLSSNIGNTISDAFSSIPGKISDTVVDNGFAKVGESLD